MRREAFSKLLDVLGPSEEAAAIEYRKLHQRLSRFFEWNGVRDPDALADEAIDRLGRRIAEENARATVRNPGAFALGIARLLLQEEARRQQRETQAGKHWGLHDAASSTEAEEMDRALQHCLAKLPPERRALIENYYASCKLKKSELHRELANDLGLTVNALRNRALRTRQDLEACMRRFFEDSL
jgi:DNA-directed RNA polymerase specialized sigma24 family protein